MKEHTQSNPTTTSQLTTLLEKFWRISLYVTDDAISKLYVTVRFRQIEGNSRKFRYIELNISVTSKIF